MIQAPRSFGALALAMAQRVPGLMSRSGHHRLSCLSVGYAGGMSQADGLDSTSLLCRVMCESRRPGHVAYSAFRRTGLGYGGLVQKPMVVDAMHARKNSWTTHSLLVVGFLGASLGFHEQPQDFLWGRIVHPGEAKSLQTVAFQVSRYLAWRRPFWGYW